MQAFENLPREQDPFEMDWPWSEGVAPQRHTLEKGLDRSEALLREGDAAGAMVQLCGLFDELPDRNLEPRVGADCARLFRLTAQAHSALGDRELATELMDLGLAVALACREPAGIAAAMLEGFMLELAA